MNEKVKEWLTPLVAPYLASIKEVGEVFTDYFGEDLVDAQIDVEHLTTYIIGDASIGRVINMDSADFPKDVSAVRWEFDRRTPIINCDEIYFAALTHEMKRIYERNKQDIFASILVRFPKVTVTNEFDKSIEISELYARIRVRSDGTFYGSLEMMRAEYTAEQYLSGYAHSHLPGAYLEWMRPCLGSGPIYNTIGRLCRENDLNIWGLFCYELAKYVTVESIAGTPYIRMENVHSGVTNIIEPFPIRNTLRSSWLHEQRGNPIPSFIKYYIRTQEFPLAFVDGCYVLGKEPIDFLIEISQLFIKWYNRQFAIHAFDNNLGSLLRAGTMKKYIINNRILYRDNGNSRLQDLTTRQGAELFKFKGKMVTLNFTENYASEDMNIVTLLEANIVSHILMRFLDAINYEHSSKRNTKDEGTDTSGKKCQII